MKLVFRYNLLCDNCNWEFSGFAVPGTVPSRSKKKKSKTPALTLGKQEAKDDYVDVGQDDESITPEIDPEQQADIFREEETLDQEDQQEQNLTHEMAKKKKVKKRVKIKLN